MAHLSARLRRRPRSAFTLVEVLVAVVLIDIGVFALVAGTSVLARRQVEVRVRLAASRVAANRLQELAAAPCVTASGRATHARGISEYWSVRDVGGAQREIMDSVVFLTAHQIVLRTRVPC